MKTKKANLSNIYLLVILSLTYTASHYIPILQYAMLFIMIGMVLPIRLVPSFFTTKMFLMLIIYALIVFFNVFMGDNYFNEWMMLVYEVSYLYIPITMLYYAFTSGDERFQNRTLLLFFIILVLTTIATGVFSNIYPSVVRHYNDYSEKGNNDFYDSLYRFGFTTYQYTHALVGLLPVIVMGLKNNRMPTKVKILEWIAFVALLAMAYYSGSFACLVLSIVGVLIPLVISRGKSNSNFLKMLSIIVIATLFITPSIRISFLDVLVNNVDSESDFYEKIIELKDIETYGANSVEGDFSTRRQLYSSSVSVNVSGMIIGSDGSNLGNHSTFLDRLGTLGLLGIVPYIVLLILIVTFTIKSIPINCRIFYWIGLVIAALLFFTKAVNSWEFWFSTLFILPITTKLLAGEGSSNKRTKVSQVMAHLHNLT